MNERDASSLQDASSLRDTATPECDAASPETDRRDFVQIVSAAAMTVGLVLSYGTFFATAIRFLYVADGRPLGWQFLSTVGELPRGKSLAYTAPSGAQVVVTRQGEGDRAEDFVALSSVCPHLGCQVHWEPQNDRFFCPCHNGAFDSQGNPTQGPPAAAGQELTRFPLKVEDGLLFIQAPLESVTDAGGEEIAASFQPGSTLQSGFDHEWEV